MGHDSASERKKERNLQMQDLALVCKTLIRPCVANHCQGILN